MEQFLTPPPMENKTDNELIQCALCGQSFDPANLTSVMMHEHDDETNPAMFLGVKGKKIEDHGKQD